MSESPVSRDRPRSLGHEPDTVHSRAVVLTGLGILVAIGVTLAAMRWLQADAPGPMLAATARPPQEEIDSIRHWSHPSLDLRELQRRERRLLTTYGWIDREAGLVRMPISQAMRLVAEGKRPEAAP